SAASVTLVSVKSNSVTGLFGALSSRLTSGRNFPSAAIALASSARVQSVSITNTTAEQQYRISFTVFLLTRFAVVWRRHVRALSDGTSPVQQTRRSQQRSASYTEGRK